MRTARKRSWGEGSLTAVRILLKQRVVSIYFTVLIAWVPLAVLAESHTLLISSQTARSFFSDFAVSLAGLAWNREFFNGLDNDRSSAEAQLGQTLSHRLSSRVSLKEQLFIFPNLSNGGEYRINFDTSVVADVTNRIGWQLTLSDRYLSNPPGGFKKNDLLLTTGLRVKLGALK